MMIAERGQTNAGGTCSREAVEGVEFVCWTVRDTMRTKWGVSRWAAGARPVLSSRIPEQGKPIGLLWGLVGSDVL